MAEMIDGAGNIPDIREMVNSAVSGEDGARMNWMMNLLPWTQTFSLGFWLYCHSIQFMVRFLLYDFLQYICRYLEAKHLDI